jgi:hypothetical protein
VGGGGSAHLLEGADQGCLLSMCMCIYTHMHTHKQMKIASKLNVLVEGCGVLRYRVYCVCVLSIKGCGVLRYRVYCVCVLSIECVLLIKGCVVLRYCVYCVCVLPIYLSHTRTHHSLSLTHTHRYRVFVDPDTGLPEIAVLTPEEWTLAARTLQALYIRIYIHI